MTDRVEVHLDFVDARGRLTTALRLLLATPPLLALLLLNLLAFVVATYGWFAALILGRLPRFPADYLTGVLSYSARVGAYTYLLTDRWPPAKVAASDSSIQLTVTPGSLNHWSVLFRIVLCVPAAVMVAGPHLGRPALRSNRLANHAHPRPHPFARISSGCHRPPLSAALHRLHILANRDVPVGVVRRRGAAACIPGPICRRHRKRAVPRATNTPRHKPMADSRQFCSVDGRGAASIGACGRGRPATGAAGWGPPTDTAVLGTQPRCTCAHDRPCGRRWSWRGGSDRSEHLATVSGDREFPDCARRTRTVGA